jgi:hypothetical protein
MTNTFSARMPFLEPTAEPRRTRAEAARINGAKSRGPKTAEGKRISSKNALREGVIAKRVTPLPNRGGERLDYSHHLNGLKAEFKPQSRFEMNLVELIAKDFVLLAQVGQATIGQFTNSPRRGVEFPKESVSDVLFELDIIEKVLEGLNESDAFSLPDEARVTFVRMVGGSIQVWQDKMASSNGPPRRINHDALSACRWLDLQHVEDVAAGKVALAAEHREPWTVLLGVLKDEAHRRLREAMTDEQFHEQACRSSLDADALPLLERLVDLEGKIQRSLESRIELFLRTRRARKSL